MLYNDLIFQLVGVTRLYFYAADVIESVVYV